MKSIAYFFSIVFHPLFMAAYMTLILLWTNPFSFGWRSASEADMLLIIVVMTTIAMPVLSILMLKKLGWIHTYELETQYERIGPFLVSGVMYLSLYLHLTRAESFPVSLRVVVLGTLIALWACFFINFLYKISLHAAGMGGLVALIILTRLVFGYGEAHIDLFKGVSLVLPVQILLYISLLLAGIVCTSRLILKAHTRREIYSGFGLGFAAIMMTWFILR